MQSNLLLAASSHFRHFFHTQTPRIGGEKQTYVYEFLARAILPIVQLHGVKLKLIVCFTIKMLIIDWPLRKYIIDIRGNRHTLSISFSKKQFSNINILSMSLDIII